MTVEEQAIESEPVPHAGQDKTYFGLRRNGQALVDVATAGGALYRLPHRVYHSPTGYEWGYGGSGPADLARSILWDHLAEEPEPALYQAFKRDYIACLLVAEWKITTSLINAWLANQKETSS